MVVNTTSTVEEGFRIQVSETSGEKGVTIIDGDKEMKEELIEEVATKMTLNQRWLW